MSAASELKQFSAKEFAKVIPQFTVSRQGVYTIIDITPILGADGYEVYRDGKLINKEHSARQEFAETSDARGRYSVRAWCTLDGMQLRTQLSNPISSDMVEQAKLKTEKLNAFFDLIKEAGDLWDYQDLEVAKESLLLAGSEAYEREERRRQELEAEKLRKQAEQEQKRRLAAAKRAEARRRRKEQERIESITRMDLPLDWNNAYAADERTEEHCDTISDGLMASLELLGIVDIEFISAVTGEEMKKVIEELKGAIYQDPLYWDEVFYKGWVTADEYLSGNLQHKYRIAKEANETYNGYFQSNITALEAVMEPELAAKDIYVTIGSPWLPPQIIDDFIAYMAFGGQPDSRKARQYYEQCMQSDYAVRHDEYTGKWEIPEKTRFRKSAMHGYFEEVCFKKYGTARMDMMDILECTLNMRSITVTDADPLNKKKRILNTAETTKAIEKQKHMIEVFQKWVWQDKERKAGLQAAYCSRYGNIRRRVFDGSFLTFPGMSENEKLYDYQKNAVARILFSPNTLLAHDVGSGKTFTMTAAGMELRRLGRSNKNLYVVPNGIITQWESIFHRLYPQANILTVSHKNFSVSKRNDTLLQVRDGDYDAILMTYSCFDMLSLSKKYYQDLYTKRLKLLEKAKASFKSDNSLEAKRKSIQNALDALQKSYQITPQTIPFDDLGITAMFVDEAHNFKNIDLEGVANRIRGASVTGSARCNAMMDKVHCVQRMNNGGKIVFATGTPITNSLSDLYAIQKYLQEGELEFQGIRTFAAWSNMFAEIRTEYEIDVDTNSYHLVTRFSRFCNLPELAAILSSIADFHRVDASAGLPGFEGYDDSLRVGSEAFRDYLQEVSNRADDIRKHRVPSQIDNMLKLTSDGRKAALDMRLIDPIFGIDPEAKVVRCAENIMEVYEATRDIRGTQLVFCDISTPKDGFNLYDELKSMLIMMGMPKEQIAYIHDAQTDADRKALFGKMCSGELSVLIGSTAKMGHGMNVQERLAAIHHLDVPWRPADMVQREGRILRQGNTVDKVRIFRYITKSSFDAYSWQLLETKQRFISQIMSGKIASRSGSDVDDTVLSYGEVKALAVGSPLIKRRVEVCNELDRYRLLQADYIEDRTRREAALTMLPERIRETQNRIKNCKKDIETFAKNPEQEPELRKQTRAAIHRAATDNPNSDEDIDVLTYRGFRIVIPAHMIPRLTGGLETLDDADADAKNPVGKPTKYIRIVGSGSYNLEIRAETAITRRLDYFLDNLPLRKKAYEDELMYLENRKASIEQALQNQDAGYAAQITALEEELAKLNKKLGLDKEST